MAQAIPAKGFVSGFEPRRNLKVLYQGTTEVVPNRAQKHRGFSPCGAPKEV
jgi:hypothetical protein